MNSNLTVKDLMFTLERKYLDEAFEATYSEGGKVAALRDALFTVFTDIVDMVPEMAQATTTIAFVPGTVEYALPAAFSVPVELYIEITGSPPTRCPIPILSSTLAGQGNSTAYIRNAVIGVFLNSNPGTLKLDYIKRATFPALFNDTINVPDEWFPLIALRAAIDINLFKAQISAAKLQQWEGRYKMELDKLVSVGAKFGRDARRYTGV